MNIFSLLTYHFQKLHVLPFLRKSVLSAIQGMIRNPFLSISNIFVITFITLFFNALLAINIFTEQTIQDINKKVDISIEIQKNADPFSVRRLVDAIESLPYIAEVKHISSKEALEEFSKRHPDINSFLDRYNLKNPLPSTIGIITKSLDKNPEILQFLQQPSYKNVIVSEQITLGTEQNKYIEKLIQITGFVQNVSTWLLIVFTIVTLMIVFNAIQVRVTMRKKEIKIMRLVGATYRFIRIPFLIEGVLVTILGVCFSAILTFALLFQLYSVMDTIITNPIILSTVSEIIESFEHSFGFIFLCEIATAFFVGIFVSFLAIERFLRKKGHGI